MPLVASAHDRNQRTRTKDVDSSATFASLLLTPTVARGLAASGFVAPSPIQLRAIPLGRAGFDLIAQAKSGTGKTCVFSVVALEAVTAGRPGPQVLMLAPTREIAVQISQVVSAIGQYTGTRCHVFIGGLPVANDRDRAQACDIAIGTPGRVGELLKSNVLHGAAVRLLVLDEADKLLQRNYLADINAILECLPERKQIMSFSATYPESVTRQLNGCMVSPQHIRLDAEAPSLLGVRHFFQLIAGTTAAEISAAKVETICSLFASLSFKQCIVFCQLKTRAEGLCHQLNSRNWHATFLTGDLAQTERLSTMDDVRDFRVRVLVTTDLTARGVDLERVNLVINYDVADCAETYLHRAGRTGRFGTRGLAVSLVSSAEKNVMDEIAVAANVTIEPLPEHVPPEFYAIEDDTEVFAPPAAKPERRATSSEPGPPGRAKPKNKKKSNPKALKETPGPPGRSAAVFPGHRKEGSEDLRWSRHAGGHDLVWCDAGVVPDVVWCESADAADVVWCESADVVWGENVDTADVVWCDTAVHSGQRADAVCPVIWS